MMTRERIQALIHAVDAGGGPGWLRFIPLAVAVLALAVLYDLTAYRGFNTPEAMDAAQVARHLSEGKGYSTDFIRPFSVYLVRKHNQAGLTGDMVLTNTDFARLKGSHPDLANPPVYPTVLAGMMKLCQPDWKAETRKLFWSEGGRFTRYQPEFLIAIFNQMLLIVVVLLTFLLARAFFDPLAAWLAALLTLGSDLLWKFSVSGQSTLLLLVIFLGLLWCLVKIEGIVRQVDGLVNPSNPVGLGEANPPVGVAGGPPRGPSNGLLLEKRRIILAMAVGALVGLGALTRYSFGWMIVPVVVYLALFGGVRRTGLAVAAFLTFAFVVSPWLARNLAVSGTFFGTAGYAVAEGTFAFPGSRLMQSLNPDMTSAYWVTPYLRKFMENTRVIFQGDLLRLGGGWVGILFFASLLLGLRNVAARRLRYFTLMCLGVFVVVQALGRTQLSAFASEVNSENLLVLLTPLVMIFGVAFFLTLLDQMKVPSPQLRFAVIGLVVALACQPLIATLLPPKPSPVSYPPYYPPDVQKIAGWMRTDELLMSDIPWAVAWYGQRQCTWTTINSQYEYYALNDSVKHVSGLYLTLNTLDAKLFSECLQGGVDSWGNFVYKTLSANQLPPGFPLRNFPYESLLSGLFLADHQRW